MSILVLHLGLAFILALLFISRLVLIIRQKNSSQIRKLFYLDSGLLVLSGVLLSVLGKLSITTICLESLGLVAAVALADVVLAHFDKKITHIKI
jgi:hypothetical protein